MELVKRDDKHIYRLEDKGSSIVRIKITPIMQKQIFTKE